MGLEQLQLEQLVFVPIQYREETVSGKLTVRAVVEVSSDQEGALRDALLQDEIQVVREGLSQETRRMRSGKFFWSSHEDGNKYNLTLSDATDEPAPRWTLVWGLEDRNARRTLAYYQGLVDRLISTLLDKGILSQDELHGLEQGAMQDQMKRIIDFFRVDDAEQLFDSS